MKRRILALFLSACLLAGIFPTAVLAAPAGTPTDKVDSVTPVGTTIDMFDYWVNSTTSETDARTQDDTATSLTSVTNLGINSGHTLKFTSDGRVSAPYNNYNTHINVYTGQDNGPKTGIVQNQLVDGYPKLSASLTTENGQQTGIDESLAYLFDSSSVAGKKAFMDVGGLLRVNSDGYYTYSSTQNFAELDEVNNTFVLYDTWAITGAGHGSLEGQFFPFTSPTVASGKNSLSSDLNHFFGMHMSTQFIQPENGQTDDKKDVTYEFQGDDDVWVFIDGVLVADLGGIHDAVRVSINFASGDVTVSYGTSTSSTEKLSAIFQRVLNNTNGFNGDTFADGTYHTLDFFYLERGGNESNMWMQYNLEEIPPTYIMKMDQDGRPIDNVHFDLSLAGSAEVIAHGTTDDEGQLVLTYADSQGAKANKLLSLQDLYTANPPADGDSLNLVLKESADSLTGYRKVGDISLRLEKKGDDYILLSNDVWTKGVYATPSVTVSAPKTVTLENPLDGANTADLSVTNAAGDKAGIMFGVILAWIGENGPTNDTIEDQSKWVPVHGNDTKGWTIEDEDFQGTTSDSFVKNLSTSLTDYYNKNGSLDGYIYTFDVGSDGNWSSTIESLPGDINSYYFIVTKSGGTADLSDVRFTTAYYYTTARTLGAISDNNTVRVDSDGFDRDFAATVRVPNIKNYLVVQRLDETGKPVLDENGDAIPATFELYEENDITIDADGSYTINTGVTPYETAQTRNYEKGANGTKENPDGDRFTMDNAAYFHKAASDGAVGAGLEEGVYYLIETKAPAGYTRNSTPVKVVVDEDGVHADAGGEDDGISTVVGVGSLVASMAQFGSVGKVDQTLTKITATKQVSELAPDETGAAWGNPAQTEAFPLKYSTRAALQYAIELDENYNPVKIDGVTDNAAVLVPDTYGFVSTTGWNWIKVTQRDAKRDSGNANITELPDTDLTKLFSGTTTVRVASGPIGDLTISKTVVKQSEDNITTAALDEEQKFSFDVALGFEYTPGDSIVETSADLEDIGLAGTYAYTVSKEGTEVESGTLTIVENTSADPADPASYSINTVTAATGTTTHFTDGKLQLADKESITITGLPVDTTYTVTEDAEEGYNATRVSVNGTETVGRFASGKIESAAETDTLAFTNIYGDLHGLTVEYYLENTDPDSKVTEADDGSTLGQVYDEIAENASWKIAVSETDVSDALHTAPATITVGGKNYIIDAIRVEGDDNAVIATDATSASGTMPDTAVTVKLIYTLDEIGGTDGGGDGIPDKYQATVTYQIVGGYWSGTDDADKVEVFTVKQKETDGTVTDLNVTLGTKIPSVADATPKPNFKEPGAWVDTEPTATTPVVDGTVYTYRFDGVTYAIDGITKEWVDGTNIQIPADVNYVLPEFENGSVVVPSEGVTLLYRITVTGEANAEFAVTDAGAELASRDDITQKDGTITGKIPAGATSVTFYVTKHFTVTDITADGKLTNTATVASNDPSTTDPGDKDDEATTPATPADSVVTKAPVAKGDNVPDSIHVRYTPVTRNGSDYEVTVSEDETSVTLLYAVTVTSNGKTNTTVTLQDPGAVYVGSTTGDFTVTPIYAADGIDEPVLPDIDGTETPVPDGTETEVPDPDEGIETPAPGETEEPQEPDAEGTEEPAEGEDLSAQSIFYDSTPATTDTVEVKFNSAGTAVVYFTKTFRIDERFTNSVIVDGDEKNPVESPDVVVKEEERPGLSVTKSVNKHTAEVGDKLTYTITVKNKGNTVLSKIKVTDEMLGVEETIDTLNPGRTWEKSYTYTVRNSDAGDTIYNTAVAEAEDGTKATDTSSGTKITWPDDDDDDDDDDNSGGQGSTNLNTDDHYSYIIGYKDGYLKPYGTITRGEVATIFFRLLTDEARDKYWSQTNRYSDCSADLWCNNAISTLSNMGIIDGYEDGTFRPYGKITRAQFAKIAVGFFETTQREYAGYFTDIAPDAWYTNYVEAAARVGLIQGFEDGTFRPNTNITRAQACVIVNRALGRKPDEDHLLSERQMITWPDNNPGDWFYADMQEATNSHDYRWLSNGKEKQYMEQWTKKLEQRDWAALEHAWSTAHSAPGGEVVK